ncbi:MAG: hypothetical protein NXI12_10400 [Alphaproteobacteria bacterium]|nr:hypothetical protein [Alphaproteobacteria bacterium]
MTPALTALALLATQPAPVEAGPGLDQLWLLRAGDEACALFEPPARALLDAAIAQARDDQVRAGADPRRLDDARRRVTAAGPSGCDDERLAPLIAGHERRIADLAVYSDLTFPGVVRQWRVDRGAVRTGRAGEPRWRVSQRTAGGEAWFGVFEQDGEMHLAVAFNDAERHTRSALAFRDSGRQPFPMDFTAGGLLPAPDGDPAAAWGAGARAQTRATASGRLDEAAAAYLAPADGAPARGFLYPDSVLQRLAALTPREAVAVELYDRTGQISRRFWIEVGGLKAALAMQAIPMPAPEPAPAQATSLAAAPTR